MRKIAFFIGFMCSTGSFAASPSALHCRTLRLNSQQPKVLLQAHGKTSQQRLYFIKNTSKTDVWLKHSEQHASGLQAGWETSLRPKHWTALAVDTDRFLLNCLELKPGSEQYVACNKVIEICQAKRAQFSQKATGTYWVADDENFNDLRRTVHQRGIKLSA